MAATAAATSGDDDLGTPTLIDGNANGWWLAPTTDVTRVEISWPVQRSLNIAFAITALAVATPVAQSGTPRRRRLGLVGRGEHLVVGPVQPRHEQLEVGLLDGGAAVVRPDRHVALTAPLRERARVRRQGRIVHVPRGHRRARLGQPRPGGLR